MVFSIEVFRKIGVYVVIAFVGIDGSGKTTLLTQFAEFLKEKGKEVQIIKAISLIQHS